MKHTWFSFKIFYLLLLCLDTNKIVYKLQTQAHNFFITENSYYEITLF